MAVLAVGALAFGLQRRPGPLPLDAQVLHIASQVRCPVCDGETAAESQAAPSVEIRAQIRQELQQGMKPSQILNRLVADYGSSILEKPPAKGLGLLVWVLPFVGVAAMAAGLGLVLRRWSRADPPGAGERELEQVPEESLVDERVAPELVAATARVVGEPDHFTSAATALEVGLDEAGLDEGAGAQDEETEAGVDLSPPPGSSGRGPLAGPSHHRRWLLVGAVGLALVAGGTGWAVASAVSPRAPGQTITGLAFGPGVEASYLKTAQADQAKGDDVDALKAYQQVLASDPNQVQALTGEGWLLAETQQPTLLAQGISLLTRAEQVDPSYGPAHIYRGIAYLSEGDYQASIPELKWYLAHDPDPTLVAKVKAALSQAEAAVAAARATGQGS